MLSTGVRTPVGIKISGADVKKIEEIGAQVEFAPAAGTRHAKRGLRSARAEVISSISNGTATNWAALRTEHRRGADGRAKRHRRRECYRDDPGRERYPVNVPVHARFSAATSAPGACWCRSAADSARSRSASWQPTISAASGPAMLRNEDGLLTGYVYVDVDGRGRGEFVRKKAQAC